MILLDVKEINTFYGMSHILFNVSIYIGEAEIVGLLGRNGAGKSTTLRSIMGLNIPTSGRITFKGEEISGKPSYVIANKGIGYVPEEKRIFKAMTVIENLEIGTKKGEQNGDQWTIEKVFNLFPMLEKYCNHIAGKLSGGEQQMLTIARTLMGNPELLLLDEPTTGLSPLIIKALRDNIFELSKSKLAILLAEQNVKFALELSHRCYIIDKGEIQYHGQPKELSNNQKIMKQYLAL
jgi:branched-chain amino acid transport system ATP-binding protein